MNTHHLEKIVFLSVVLAIPILSAYERPELVGRIIAYDWMRHATSPFDEFVLELRKPLSSGAKYARVVYPSYPMVIHSNRRIQPLPRNEFFARGPWRRFIAKLPGNFEEKKRCLGWLPDHEIMENGKLVRVPRFLASAGADRATVDKLDIKSLPCFVLLSPKIERLEE